MATKTTIDAQLVELALARRLLLDNLAGVWRHEQAFDPEADAKRAPRGS